MLRARIQARGSLNHPSLPKEACKPVSRHQELGCWLQSLIDSLSEEQMHLVWAFCAFVYNDCRMPSFGLERQVTPQVGRGSYKGSLIMWASYWVATVGLFSEQSTASSIEVIPSSSYCWEYAQLRLYSGFGIMTCPDYDHVSCASARGVLSQQDVRCHC